MHSFIHSFIHQILTGRLTGAWLYAGPWSDSSEQTDQIPISGSTPSSWADEHQIDERVMSDGDALSDVLESAGEKAVGRETDGQRQPL